MQLYSFFNLGAGWSGLLTPRPGQYPQWTCRKIKIIILMST